MLPYGKDVEAMKRMMLLCAALAVLLSGCALWEEPPAPAVSTPAAEETAFLTIAGREIPAWRYFCWLDRGIEAMAARYEAVGLTPDWAGQAGEEVGAQALADTALYAAVENMAEEYALTLTAQERSALDTSPWAALPEEQQEELAGVGALYGKLCTLAQTPGSVLAPTAEELADFAGKEGYLALERILIPAGEGAADRAAEVFAQVNTGGEGAFSQAKSEGPVTFRAGEGAFDAALEEAAAALEPGQISGILESAEGFSILRRVEADTAALVVPWLDEALLSWAEEAEILPSAAYETVEIPAYAHTVLGGSTEKTAAVSSG